MKRKRLILGGLIFVLLFLILLVTAKDPNMTDSWNGKHGTPVADWRFHFLFFSPSHS